ncbi:hypothetical protein [Pseudovibrio exalbescens]|uniref:hypothetical protein n=1 Tax=Pseudovibrio exalbescens TaxID=197461 RepID=UPI0011AF4E4D|nr:hypothetical protein [Pseudovibrio exalbescens]
MTGEQLRNLRNSMGLTQNEFAKIAWPDSFNGNNRYLARKKKMRRLENGHREITEREMEGIRRVLDTFEVSRAA